ncbi:ABC transporter permease [Mucilaginibacter sp. AK015]|uniref:ABC transporter permease n=1 Tax=Mucilaginibacter sp. AK015 TaxID=2723072 RepID=UPI001610B03B|nr:ABC transporter permease [Mucilaginibacter sp. AK015]MBB5395448.1 ABC-type antimicrobial peptide transport system permease subunit [Mucilaginibacter sp. AK015]
MFKNLFKTAWRNVLRNKSYTFINIVGLGSGISVCLVIFVLIQFHLSFDNFHTKKDRIYRMLTEYHHADSKDIFYGAGIARGIPQTLKTDIPELEAYAPIFHGYNEQIQVLNAAGQIEKKFKEDGVFATTPSFFKIFDFPLLLGDANTALSNPNSVLLTKETAERYFGDWRQAMGKTIRWANKDVLKVTGIMAPIPRNTDFQFKVLFSLGTGRTASMLTSNDYDSTGGFYGCYVLAPAGMTGAQLTGKLQALMKKYRSPENKDSEVAQPLSEVHFDSKVDNYSNIAITRQMINMLWMIGAFILIIACVNFVNLATAQAVNRAKEVGIRKVLGGNRSQLQIQFLTETFVIVLISLVLSAGISTLAIPMVGKIMELPLQADMLLQVKVAAFTLVLIVMVTLIAGFYPSMVLSGFNPINALKSKLAFKTPKGISLRHALVVFQFVIAQGLIICTIIIVKQMNFFTHESMGFEKDAIVNVHFPSDSASITKLDYLKNKLRGINGIQQVSLSSDLPAGEDDNWTMFTYDNAIKQVDFYSIIQMADEQYVPTYKLKLVAGRNVAASDTVREFLVNEAVIQKLGLKKPEDALNKQIALGTFAKGKIVGVLKNFHNRSFKDEYAPMLISTLKNQYGVSNIKLSSANMSASIKGIEKLWNEVYPDYAFEYKFMDERIAAYYKQESQLSKIYQSFAAIAILLSCLGLYGLASFMAVQRIKEVGIRKVLGSSISAIVYLFSKEFVVLIGIGFAVAAPITWYLMNRWLQDYTYRIQIHWGIFVLAGIIAVGIALATVSYQLIKAALVNPVKSLRSE